jgi:hypothetical protein
MRPRETIETSRRFVRGDATVQELDVAQATAQVTAWNVEDTVENVRMADAVWAAAWAAARNVMWGVRWASAKAISAKASEYVWQTAHFNVMLVRRTATLNAKDRNS